MHERLPWEAPTVFEIDVATGTHGGGTVFSTETTLIVSPYNFDGHPLS